jgi:hypothetical protein
MLPCIPHGNSLAANDRYAVHKPKNKGEPQKAILVRADRERHSACVCRQADFVAPHCLRSTNAVEIYRNFEFFTKLFK